MKLGAHLHHKSIDNLLLIINGEEEFIRFLSHKVIRKGDLNEQKKIIQMAVADFEAVHHPMTLHNWFTPDKDRNTALRMLKSYTILMFNKKDGKTLMKSILEEINSVLILLTMQWTGIKLDIKENELGISHDPIEIPDYDFSSEKND